MGGGSACELPDHVAGGEAPLTPPSPHKGERGATNALRLKMREAFHEHLSASRPDFARGGDFDAGVLIGAQLVAQRADRDAENVRGVRAVAEAVI